MSQKIFMLSHGLTCFSSVVVLMIYSSCRFGSVLASRAIRAAHCLTSIQVCKMYKIIGLNISQNFIFEWNHE